jgi:hypothetical protein
MGVLRDLADHRLAVGVGHPIARLDLRSVRQQVVESFGGHPEMIHRSELR